VGHQPQQATISMRQIWKSISTSSAGSGRSRLGRDFLMWPTFLATGLFLLFVALFAIPRSRVFLLFFGMPVIAVGSLIPIALSCFVAVTSLKERRYLKALSALVLPIVCTIAAVNYGTTLRTCATAANYVQFYVGYPFFAHAVSQLPRNAGPRLAVFTMDGFISMSNGVAFDESDEVGLPAGQQTDEWKVRATHTELSTGVFVAKRLIGHYYLWWSD
jgi:hypothetical protein